MRRGDSNRWLAFIEEAHNAIWDYEIGDYARAALKVIDKGDTPSVCCYEHASDLERATQMIVCSECGNKRCPKATWHGYECTDSNEVGQPGSRYVAAVDKPKTERKFVYPFTALAAVDKGDTPSGD